MTTAGGLDLPGKATSQISKSFPLEDFVAGNKSVERISPRRQRGPQDYLEVVRVSVRSGSLARRPETRSQSGPALLHTQSPIKSLSAFFKRACWISAGQREATGNKLALDLNMKVGNYARSDKRHDGSVLLILKFVARRAETLPSSGNTRRHVVCTCLVAPPPRCCSAVFSARSYHEPTSTAKSISSILGKRTAARTRSGRAAVSDQSFGLPDHL